VGVFSEHSVLICELQAYSIYQRRRYGNSLSRRTPVTSSPRVVASEVLTSSARYGQLNRSECGGAHADVHVVHVKKSKRRR